MLTHKLLRRLLYRNLSAAQLAGFVLSNLTGLAIVILGIQFFMDGRPIWADDDSFIRKDYLVVNKRISAANTLGASAVFTPAQIEELESEPWVRRVGRFTSADYRVYASVNASGRSMSTYMFLESIPTSFIDVAGSDWTFSASDKSVPIIISKDYLSLYNFGFASTVGMPALSESAIKSIPLTLSIRPDNGRPPLDMPAYIVGFSNRLNTILVPEEFMAWSNARYGSGSTPPPSRLIVDVNSPGDVRIKEYMEANDLEIAGDKSGSQASFLVNVIAGVALAVGALITCLSFFILLLSISLLMQKNRQKIHSLIMLGVELGSISGVYIRLVAGVNILAYILAVIAMLAMRMQYLPSLRGMGGGASTVWPSLLSGLMLMIVLTIFNVIAVNKKVRKAFLNS